MEKIIKQLTIIIAGGALALSFGCGIEDLIKDLREDLKDYAPYSLAGRTLHGTRTSHSGSFDTAGPFTLTFTDTAFTLVNTTGGTTETGTYTYSKTFTNAGTIVLTDPTEVGNVTYEISFTSDTASTYTATGSGELTGSETGIFHRN